MSAGWKAAMMKNPKARLRADGKEQCVSLMINKQFRTKPEQKRTKPGETNDRVPKRPGIPGKITTHLDKLQNFVFFNKNHGKWL